MQQRHEETITVKTEISQAEANLDRYLAKLRSAHAIAGSIGIGGQTAPGAPAIPNPMGAAPALSPSGPAAGGAAPAPGGGLPPGVRPDSQGRLRDARGRYWGGGAAPGSGLPGGGAAPTPPGLTPIPGVDPLSDPSHPAWRLGGGGGGGAPLPMEIGGYGGAGAAGGLPPNLGPYRPYGVGVPGAAASAYAGGLYGMFPAAQRGVMGMGMGAGSRLYGSIESNPMNLGPRALRVLAGASRAIPFAGAAMGAYFGLAGQSMAQRLALGNQYQGIERSLFGLQLQGDIFTGGGPGAMADTSFLRMGASYGMGPQQALGVYGGVFSQMGMRRSPGYGTSEGIARAAFEAEISGLGSGVLGNWMSMAGAGGGATKGAAGVLAAFNQARGSARGLGMSGAREAAWLGGFSSMVGGRAEAGLTTDIGNLVRFGHNVASFGATKGGPVGARGLGGMRAARGMLGMGQRALGGFTSNFGGLAEAALFAKAAQGGGSPMEIASRLAELSGDPYAMREALTSMLGEEGAGLAMLGGGLSPDLAKGVMGAGKGAPAAFRGTPESIRGMGLKVSRAQAYRDLSRMEEVINDPAWAARLIQLQGRIETSILKISGRGGGVEKMVDALEAIVMGVERLERKLKEWTKELTD